MKLSSQGIGALFACAVTLLITGATQGGDDGKIIRPQRPLGVEFPEMYKLDEFIVVLNRESRSAIQVDQDITGPRVNIPALQQTIQAGGVNALHRLFPTAKPRAIDSKYPDLTGHYKVKIGAGADLKASMDAFERNPHVEKVEAIGIHPIYVDANDPYYRDSPSPEFQFDQWHYFDRDAETFSVQADIAWEINSGSSTVLVGVLDSGVRYYHGDLGGSDVPGPNDNVTNGNIWVNAGEIPGNGVDDDGNGYVDDVVGYDFVTSASGGAGCQCSDADCGTQDNNPADYNGHGTHVSGTIGAITNNGRQVAGVAGGFAAGSSTDSATGVKIIPLRIGWNAKCFGVDGYGFVSMDYAAQAMNYVAELVDQGYNVASINCSWGSSNSGGIDAAVNNLLAHDVMIIHAAGNSNANSPGYLGDKAGVMNVAATDRNGNGASFTNFGSWVDVAAPGVEILSTWHHFPDPSNDYIAVLDGTSMSAPHVAGIAALLESCNPSLSGPDKFSLIVNNARPYSDSRNLGSGIANAKLAMEAAGCSSQPQCSTNADCDDGNACTTDTCSSGQCSNTQISCDDGNACTADNCSGGVCSNNAINCDDGNACTIDSCDTVTGCSNEPIDCSDGDLCTTDSCDSQTGTCFNDPVNCDDGDSCTADSCNSGSGCVNTDPPCQNGDGCCPSGCNSSNDNDCGTSCGGHGTSCSSNADCCSGNCRSGTCRGN